MAVCRAGTFDDVQNELQSTEVNDVACVQGVGLLTPMERPLRNVPFVLLLHQWHTDLSQSGAALRCRDMPCVSCV
ncbi:MAG: hypothetical protein R3E31_28875 [Chloroflexota bacterium]